jgi:hypothetical protein
LHSWDDYSVVACHAKALPHAKGISRRKGKTLGLAVLLFEVLELWHLRYESLVRSIEDSSLF